MSYKHCLKYAFLTLILSFFITASLVVVGYADQYRKDHSFSAHLHRSVQKQVENIELYQLQRHKLDTDQTRQLLKDGVTKKIHSANHSGVPEHWILDIIYVFKHGTLANGAVRIDDDDYYFVDGIKQIGEIIRDGKLYVYGEDGKGLTGWYRNGSNKYFLGSDHSPVTGWYTISTTGKEENSIIERYYFAAGKCSPVTGVADIEGTEYLFDEEGRLIKDEAYMNRYATATGEVAKNKLIGNTFYDKNGIGHDVSGNQGNEGRLIFPEQGDWSVALYWAPYDTYYNQPIVDASDSAAYIHESPYDPIIADHKYQGFDIVKSCWVGEEVWIVYDGTMYRYEVVDIQYDAYNGGYGVESKKGNTFYSTQGYISMYTCNSNWNSVTCVWLQRKS